MNLQYVQVHNSAKDDKFIISKELHYGAVSKINRVNNRSNMTI